MAAVTVSIFRDTHVVRKCVAGKLQLKVSQGAKEIESSGFVCLEIVSVRLDFLVDLEWRGKGWWVATAAVKASSIWRRRNNLCKRNWSRDLCWEVFGAFISTLRMLKTTGGHQTLWHMWSRVKEFVPVQMTGLKNGHGFNGMILDGNS